jgi:hypothetical protein
MNAHPLNYTRHGVVTSELQYYRSMRKRTMIGACWLALIDEGKYESLGFSTLETHRFDCSSRIPRRKAPPITAI